MSDPNFVESSELSPSNPPEVEGIPAAPVEVPASTPSREVAHAAAPANTNAKPTEPAKKKRKQRTRAQVLADRAAALRQLAQANSGDPAVAQDAKDMEADWAAFGQLVATPGFSLNELVRLEQERKTQFVAVAASVERLCVVLGATVAGKAFVARSRGGSVINTARNLVRDTTPELIGRYQALLDDVKTELDAFDRIEGPLEAEKAGMRAAKAALRTAMDRLALSLDILGAAIERAEKRGVREKLAGKPGTVRAVKAA